MNGYGGYEEGNKRGARKNQAGARQRNGGTVIGYDQIRTNAMRGKAGANGRTGLERTSRQESADFRRGQLQVAANQKRSSGNEKTRQQPTKNRRSSSNGIRQSRDSGRGKGQYTGTEDRARARARARKRKWRRQRRMLLGGFLFLILLFAGAGLYGVLRQHRISKEKQERLEAGIVLLDSGNYEEAIVKLDEALQWSKEKVGTFEKDVLMYRAEAEYRLQDYDAAMHTYELLQETDKENVDYKTGVAYCLLAKDEVDSALALGVIDGYVYNHIAVGQIQAKEYDLALETIEKGMAAGGEEALRLLSYNQAVAWEGKGDFAKALELYQAYVDRYGSEENAELENARREIDFLKTRQGDEEPGETEESQGENDGSGNSDSISENGGSGENSDSMSENDGSGGNENRMSESDGSSVNDNMSGENGLNGE